MWASSELYRPGSESPSSNLLQPTDVLDTFPMSEILFLQIVWLSQAHPPSSDSFLGVPFGWTKDLEHREAGQATGTSFFPSFT